MTHYFCPHFIYLGIGTYKKPYKVELPKLNCKGKEPDVFKHPEGAAPQAIRQALKEKSVVLDNSWATDFAIFKISPITNMSNI